LRALDSALLQVILPLGDEADRRAGKDPKGDSERYPPGGKCVQGVTGELVCIRKAPDLEAVRRWGLSIYEDGFIKGSPLIMMS